MLENPEALYRTRTDDPFLTMQGGQAGVGAYPLHIPLIGMLPEVAAFRAGFGGVFHHGSTKEAEPTGQSAYDISGAPRAVKQAPDSNGTPADDASPRNAGERDA